MAEQSLSVVFVKSAISDLMQYKCEYNNTLSIYTRNFKNAYQLPDISDLDVEEAMGFLMYVPVLPASTKGACVFQRASVIYNYDEEANSIIKNSFANKLNTLRTYACGDSNENWELSFDIYRCNSMNVGGTIFTDLGWLCSKNDNLYYMVTSIMAYELYARLDTFKYFTKKNAVITAKHALERLISIKVCAQIMLGLLWLQCKRHDVDPLLGKLYKLCMEIIAPNFYPQWDLDHYKFILEGAQTLRMNVYQEYALVADCRVPFDMITFKINNCVDAPDNVDMYSFYVYSESFLRCMCQLANKPYEAGTNSQISFNVTFTDAVQAQSNILRHLNNKTNCT